MVTFSTNCRQKIRAKAFAKARTTQIGPLWTEGTHRAPISSIRCSGRKTGGKTELRRGPGGAAAALMILQDEAGTVCHQSDNTNPTVPIQPRTVSASNP
jgi:hypothetical protein